MEKNSNICPANRVRQVKEYYFSKKLKEVAQLNAKGMDIISLGIGGPDRPPHQSVIDTLCDVARRHDTHGYQPYVGLPSLRGAYADWYRRWYGVELNPDKEIQPLIVQKRVSFTLRLLLSILAMLCLCQIRGILHTLR